MSVGLAKSKAQTLSYKIPICSENGDCKCKHYIGRVSGGSRCNDQVDCAVKGRIYRATAKSCYGVLPASDKINSDPKPKAPSSG